ncbi:nectin-4 isoform X1 [Pleurodeles waltl]|uniref:nectin-4 isoform X1 n=1 Tax=Pleurodeles waltl TaxID=8319 RepID=UPI0037096159
MDFSGAPWTIVLLLLSFEGCLSGVVKTEDSITAVLGLDVELPCYYHAKGAEKVSQVAWSKRTSSGQYEAIVVLNTEYGAYVESPYKDRVKEQSPMVPEDGSIILKNAVQADEGIYQCRFNTFPAGNFEASLKLTVLVPPLPSLNPGLQLTEGQGKTLAASCTAEGNPVPRLSWETEVKGENITRTAVHPRSVSVTSEYYLVPHQHMNGKTLTCIISHPGLQEEKRITHVLRVGYLSDASLLGQEEDWYVGRVGASLKCVIEGHPKPDFNWTRVNGTLPQGVKAEGNTLIFQTPLSFEDGGIYICQASNGIATRQTRASISIAELVPAQRNSQKQEKEGSETQKFSLVSVSVISVAVIAGVLLAILLVAMILVSRYHKRKTRQLSVKIEELSVLSRENSRRRLNSASASVDRRSQTEETLPMRTGNHPDSLRDMSISSMMGEEADHRSYSTLTTVREIETQTELLASAAPSEDVQEGEEEHGQDEEQKEDSQEEKGERDLHGSIENHSSIKQAMDHFYPENGTLRIKPTANGIYINGRGHLV